MTEATALEILEVLERMANYQEIIVGILVCAIWLVLIAWIKDTVER